MRAERRVGRLTKRSEFVAAASGRRFHTERMTVQGLVRPSDAGSQDLLPSLRVGFTVTKRAGHATERNRMRRRLRAAALEALGPRSDVPADLVVIARRPVLTAEFRSLVADLERAVAVVTKPKPGANAEPKLKTDSKPTSRPPLT
ncbi:MAG TPA: ribonuclease P protein component [Beijerinckiaceae bacterium]|nr:ribonuclease P protein component [Beijerinckiaceae bacterium]